MKIIQIALFLLVLSGVAGAEGLDDLNQRQNKASSATHFTAALLGISLETAFGPDLRTSSALIYCGKNKLAEQVFPESGKVREFAIEAAKGDLGKAFADNYSDPEFYDQIAEQTKLALRSYTYGFADALERIFPKDEKELFCSEMVRKAVDELETRGVKK